MSNKKAKNNVYTVKVGSIVAGKLVKEGARVVSENFVAADVYADKVNKSNSAEFLVLDEGATKVRNESIKANKSKK